MSKMGERKPILVGSVIVGYYNEPWCSTEENEQSDSEAEADGKPLNKMADRKRKHESQTYFRHDEHVLESKKKKLDQPFQFQPLRTDINDGGIWTKSQVARSFMFESENGSYQEQNQRSYSSTSMLVKSKDLAKDIKDCYVKLAHLTSPINGKNKVLKIGESSQDYSEPEPVFSSTHTIKPETPEAPYIRRTTMSRLHGVNKLRNDRKQQLAEMKRNKSEGAAAAAAAAIVIEEVVDHRPPRKVRMQWKSVAIKPEICDDEDEPRTKQLVKKSVPIKQEICDDENRSRTRQSTKKDVSFAAAPVAERKIAKPVRNVIKVEKKFSIRKEIEDPSILKFRFCNICGCEPPPEMELSSFVKLNEKRRRTKKYMCQTCHHRCSELELESHERKCFVSLTDDVYFVHGVLDSDFDGSGYKFRMQACKQCCLIAMEFSNTED